MFLMIFNHGNCFIKSFGCSVMFHGCAVIFHGFCPWIFGGVHGFSMRFPGFTQEQLEQHGDVIVG